MAADREEIAEEGGAATIEPVRGDSGAGTEFLSGGGEMGALIRAYDWVSTSLGPIGDWPQSLKTAVGMILRSPVPIVMLWGEDGIMIYNDAYSVVAGGRHPQLLGSKVREGWPEVADFNDHVMKVGLAGGTLSYKEQELTLYRHGRPEQVWMDLDYSPVLDESGKPAGVMAIVVETTERVQGEGLRAVQTRVLELAIRDTPLEETLEALVKAVEAQSPTEVLGSVLLLDGDGVHLRHGAAPSLADAYNEAIDGVAIGPNVGSCGTAAHSKSPVYVSDIASDPRWADFRDLALAHGLRACWSTPILSGQGDVLGTFAMYYREPRDPYPQDLELIEFITRSASLVLERHQAEEALRASEARFRTIFEEANDYIITTDLDQIITSINPAVVAAVGYPADEIIGHPLSDFLTPDQAEQARAMLDKKLREGGTTRHTLAVNARGARRLIWEISSQLILDDSGEPTGLHAIGRDVTEQRRTEAALREQTRTLETLNRTGAAVAAELDLERLVQMVTDAGVELTGAQFGAFFYNVLNEAGESYMLYTISGVPRSAFDKFPMPRNTAVFGPTFNGEGVVRSDDIKKDPRYGKNAPRKGMPEGHLPVTSYLAVPVTSRSGEVIGGLFFGHSEAGKFSERHESLLVGIAAQAAIGIDNARLYQAAQREIEERRRAEEAVRELNQSLEERIAAAIAEREQAEEALRQSQKMEAVGQLTGGIAHDFNNLLTVITGNLDAARRHLGSEVEGRVARALGNALVGAERAATLTQRLLAFSRRQPLSPKPINPNDLVTAMSELLHRTLGETIHLETVLAAGLWRIEADSHQLENAILNLAVNARDAMSDGGKLTIETANAHLDHGYAEQHAGVAPGQYVMISVSDTGTGMDEDTLSRAFEPFFTTKEVGRGTGLGLSMVYGFVKQSGGHLRIYSEEGEGTTVKIYLPRLLGAADASEERREQIIPGGSGEETILVCEDDHDVRAYTVEVLRELGYRVIEAPDGPSALRLLGQDGQIDLLFTDVVLPSGMTGAVLAREALALRPDLRILFTTGYARDAIVHHGRLDPGVELITKPFTYADLAARVRDMLDRS